MKSLFRKKGFMFQQNAAKGEIIFLKTEAALEYVCSEILPTELNDLIESRHFEYGFKLTLTLIQL